MKKILAVLLLTFGFVSAASALDISAGFSGNMGGNIGADYSGYNGLVTGCGAYLNLDIVNGLGFQGEMNITNNQFKLSGNSVTFTDYEAIDFCFMPWFQFKLPMLSIGAGLGLNYAYYDSTLNDLDIDTSKFIPGIALGLNTKVYISRHFGIVVGAHSVLDFLPYVDVTYEGHSTTYTFKNSPFIRKAIYGSVGVDFRF